MEIISWEDILSKTSVPPKSKNEFSMKKYLKFSVKLKRGICSILENYCNILDISVRSDYSGKIWTKTSTNENI